MTEVFSITPASSKPIWFAAIIGIIILIVMVALLITAYASKSSKVIITDHSIKIAGDFWGREISKSALKISKAKPLNLQQDVEYRPRWRTWGTGLPGYASGWFRLRNKEKALVYLTDRTQVVYIPTTLGYALLLSIQEPIPFLQALQQSSS